ncbi:hypothetical protein QJQ45_012409 [Haematococcus lacustris]|nr:hypothetical protein QJQ45_012409 [Haematococcus lacustris]
MGRRSQRSKNASAIMAAQVAAGLAPWTLKAGFIAKRFKELKAELQASQMQLGSDAAASQQREHRMQAQIEELEQHNVRYRLAAAEEMAGLQADLAAAHTATIEQQQQLKELQQQLEEQQQHVEEQQQQLEEQQRQLGLLQHAKAVMAEEAVALRQRAAKGDEAAAAAANQGARCLDLEAQCQDLVVECHEQQAECLRLSAAAPPSSPTAPNPCPASQDKRIRLVQIRGPSINVLRRLISDWESKPRTGQHRHNKDELATVQLCHTQVARYSTARYRVEYSLAALRLLVDCNLSFEEVQETIVRALGLHILPGQQLEDRVPCGMTLRRAMDDICHQAHKHQSADVKILFAVCDSAASNVGKHSGVVMRLAAAKIKAGHQVHNIWVVHCWEHVLQNSVRHLCQAYGCSAQMQREGHNSQLCWMLEHVSTHFKKHPLAEALQVELACLTRWGTYGRIAVWILQHYATLLVQLQKYNTPDITAGQQKTVQCLLSNLLDVKIMVHCAVLAALDRAVLQHEQLWAQSNSSRWMCHWHSHHHSVMLELMAAMKQPRRVLAEAYAVGCKMAWGPSEPQLEGQAVTEEQVDSQVRFLVRVFGGYYTMRMKFLDELPYLTAALGDTSTAGRQWAASMHLRYLEREQLLGHLEGEDASKYDPLELHKMTADLEVTRDTGMLTPAMEQLLSRYYRATHMTNAVPETMLKQLNNDSVLRMNAEGMSGRAKLAMEDTTAWVADGVVTQQGMVAATAERKALQNHGATASPGTAASPGGAAGSPGGAAASPSGTPGSPGGAAASPGGTQAPGTNKARKGKRQQQGQSKAERVMKRIRCLVSMPSDEQQAAAVAVRDGVTARQKQQQVDSKRLKELEDTARGVYNRFEPPLPALRSKSMTVEELKHLSQKLGVGSVGKNRRQLLERIEEYCKQ